MTNPETAVFYFEIAYSSSDSHRRAARLRRRSLALSVIAHFMVLGYVQASARHHDRPRPELERKKFATIFLAAAPPPKPRVDPPSKPNLIQQPAAVPQIVAEEPVPHSESSPDEARVDATRATISYEDHNHNFPAILRMYRGYIGFGLQSEKDDYVRRVFDVAGSEQRLGQGIVSLDGFGLALTIRGSGYPIVDEIRRRYHLEDYIAYALFPDIFHEELQHTIKKAALTRYGGGRVKSVTVILSTDSYNGLVAGDVVMAGGSH